MAKILIFAATGKVGSALGARLVAQGHDVHGVTRTSTGADILGNAGITPIIGNIARPDEFAGKITGFDAAFLASADAPDQDRLEYGLIDLLAAANVPHVVKLSAQSAGLSPPVSFGVQHHASETHLKASGLGFTILRPTFFQQSLLLMKDDIAKKSSIIAPMGTGQSAMVHVDDIADVAACCLTDTAYIGTTHTLTGPAAIGFGEIAALLSDRLGRKVKHVSPPSIVARIAMPFLTGMPRWQTSLIVDLMVAISKGAQSPVTQDVQAVTGRKPRSIQDFLDQHIAEFRG